MVRLRRFVLMVMCPIGMPRHSNVLDVVEFWLVLAPNRERAVDRIMNGPRAGVRLEFDVELVRLIQPGRELRGIGFIGEGSQKTALAFEYRIGTGKSKMRHASCGYPVARGRTGVE